MDKCSRSRVSSLPVKVFVDHPGALIMFLHNFPAVRISPYPASTNVSYSKLSMHELEGFLYGHRLVYRFSKFMFRD